MRTLLKKDLSPYFLMLYKTLQTPEDRKSFLESYSYFVSVEQSLGIKLEPNEYPKIIDLGKFKSKQDINRALFAALHKETTNTNNTNLLGLEKVHLATLNTQFASRNSSVLSELIQNIKNLESNIAQYTRYIDNYCAQLFTAKNQLTALSANTDISDRIITQFDLIVKNNDFTNVYYDSITKTLHAVTAHDCILRDPDGLVDYNFGKFDIVYDIRDNHINILPFVNNLTWSADISFIHPHVFRDKNMCFGSANASVVDCLKTFEIAKIYTICNMILHEYNPASPTIQISSFNSSATLAGYKHIINLQYNLRFHKELTQKIQATVFEDNMPYYTEYVPEPTAPNNVTDEVEAA